MNNIINDVNSLKEDILVSKEYLEYKNYNDILDNNEEIKSLINDIVLKQKEAVSKLNKDELLNKEIDDLYDKLNTYEDYIKYIDASKKLNNLLSNIINNFEDYFNSLIS